MRKGNWKCSGTLVKVGSVKIWKTNPNKDKDPEAVPKLARLLKTVGQRAPLVVWRRNRVIYKGNHTLRAARLLKWTHIRVSFQDFPSEKAAVAFGVSDNVSGKWTEEDPDALLKLMDAEGFGDVKERSRLTGFTEVQLMELGAESGFAAHTFAEAAEEFEKRHKGEAKRNPLWFWFEVPDEGAFEFVQGSFARTPEKGKRLHRELDFDKLAVAFKLKGGRVLRRKKR